MVDPEFNIAGPSDNVLAAEVVEQFMLERKARRTEALHLRDSYFGWVVKGSMNSSGTSSSTLQIFHVESRPSLLEKFWQLEDVPHYHTKTKEEVLCENHFTQTTRRDDHGHFVAIQKEQFEGV